MRYYKNNFCKGSRTTSAKKNSIVSNNLFPRCKHTSENRKIENKKTKNTEYKERIALCVLKKREKKKVSYFWFCFCGIQKKR